MIGHYLSNNNESTTVSILPKFFHLNRPSVDGIGTYCLDTASRTWRKVGDWTLPFRGRVEYAPELKLWFGACLFLKILQNFSSHRIFKRMYEALNIDKKQN
jgi:hypothetical protein